jgi:predicted Zn-dependent protease
MMMTRFSIQTRHAGKVAARAAQYAATLLLITLLAFLSGCAANPVTGKKELVLISESSEIQMGQENYLFTRQSQGGSYNIDPGLSAYVNSVGQRMAQASDRPNLPYEFVVLNNSVPNAWALPGGKIAVNRGMLIEMETEAELAAVLSHEVVHAAARHSAKSVERGMLFQIGMIGISLAASKTEYANLIVGASGLGLDLISRRYSREAELESDLYGMQYMSKAGYDPQAAVALQQTFVHLSKDRQSDWLSGLFATHPPSQERVNTNIATAATLPAGGTIGAEEYQRRIAGIQRNKPAYDAYDKGQKALAGGDATTALRLADEALKIEPREAMFYGLKGDVKASQKLYREALMNYDRAVQRNDQFFRYLLQRGLVREKLGDRQGSWSDLQASIKLLPTAPAHYSLGNLGLQANQRELAIKHFRAAASSKSEVGKAAGVALARLDLPENPGNYIAAKTALDQDGYVVVAIQNRSPVSIRNVTVAVGYFSGQGALQAETTAVFRKTLAPGKQAAVATRLGPLPDANHIANVRYKIVDASVVE